LNFVNSVTSMFGAATGTVIVDRVGRRKVSRALCNTGTTYMLTDATALSSCSSP
jgi:hypothetical protein